MMYKIERSLSGRKADTKWAPDPRSRALTLYLWLTSSSTLSIPPNSLNKSNVSPGIALENINPSGLLSWT